MVFPTFFNLSLNRSEERRVGKECGVFEYYWCLYAAASLQSCPTLCNPIDGSPPGSPVPGILQARTLEWVAISFSNAWKWKVKVKSLSRVRPSVTPWTAAYQAPPSMGFSSSNSLELTQMCSFLWLSIKSDLLYSLQPKMEKLYTVSKNKTRSWLWLRPWTPYCQIQT